MSFGCSCLDKMLLNMRQPRQDHRCEQKGNNALSELLASSDGGNVENSPEQSLSMINRAQWVLKLMDGKR